MKKIRIAVCGYGNVGRGVIASIRNNPDLELAGIVSRSPERVKKSVHDIPVLAMADTAKWLEALAPDVAVLCGGSKGDLPKQGPELAQYVNTVDSFDNHSQIPNYFQAIDQAAKKSGHVSIISTGWDPGIFSLERVLAEAFIPGAKAKGFYGLGPKGGLSMGHSDALRTIEGVQDARQFTHAVPEAMDQIRRGEHPDFVPGDMHTRECVIVPKPGADLAKIEATVRAMPGYFAGYKTSIKFVTQEELLRDYPGFPHDGAVLAAGVTGDGNPAQVEYRCIWGSNPEATGNVLAAHARACFKLAAEGKTGAMTILDIPPRYLSSHSREELLAHWM